MPTPFGLVLLGVVVVGAVVGVVLLVRQSIRRNKAPSHGGPSRGTGPEAPWDENTAAAQRIRETDRGGWGA